MLTLILTGNVEAQRTFHSIGADLRNGLGDIWYIWSSPFHAGWRDWTGAAIAGASVVATAPFDADIDEWIVGHPNSAIMKGLKPVRERESGIKLYDLGSAKLIHPIVGVMYVAGVAADSRKIRDAAMGCMAAQQANGLVRQVIYKTITRPRPYLDNADPYDIQFEHGEWPERSFFGGHAANIVACMTFFNERYELGAAEPLLYALAIAASTGRMADRRHWASDTVLGIIFGHAIGKNIGRRSRQRHEAESSSGAPGDDPDPNGGAAGFFITPVGPGGVAVGWRRGF